MVLPLTPPRPTTVDGSARHVGVEIEFALLDCVETAAIVQRMFGGKVEEIDPHRYRIQGTRLGDFTVELDMMFAHPQHPANHAKGFVELVEDTFRYAVGAVGSLWMPFEIAMPPVTFGQLDEIYRLIAALREGGAIGTQANPLHAFGMHLNVEIADTSADYVLDHMKAFMLLSPWLRDQIVIDPTRDLAPYIERFPNDYVIKVIDPAYRPDLAGLIEDYLAANPTRNRELDMLPVLAYLDRERIFRVIDDAHVRPRPAFHYRLPDSRVDAPDWGVVPDWNRWVEVERLAADPTRLEQMAQAYISCCAGEVPADWHDRARQWISP